MDLYVHFPFCRAKCAYCALHSRAGVPVAARAAYAAETAAAVAALPGPFETVYFGGGTPTQVDLAPVLAAVRPRLADGAEFTVELHPRDVTSAALAALRAGGVNRISLGVQCLDDAVLAAMRRGHTAAEAEAAFLRIRSAGFANAGLDLIAGYPGVTAAAWKETLARTCALAPVHVSCYTLIREPRTALDLAVRKGRVTLPDDDAALEQADAARAALAEIGLARYEISSFARPGFACRHNLAVWRGGDYTGLGEGAHGRVGCVRTVSGVETARLAASDDARERALFALRLVEGIDPDGVSARWPVLRAVVPHWRATLAAYVPHGLVRRTATGFALTERGFEVCDAILAELV